MLETARPVMTAMSLKTYRDHVRTARQRRCLSSRIESMPGAERRAFTLLEILVVVVIIGILITLMTAVVTNSMRKAREAATAALIQKIDGLLEERIRGFDRATKSPDFQRVVDLRKKALEAASIFGVSTTT